MKKLVLAAAAALAMSGASALTVYGTPGVGGAGGNDGNQSWGEMLGLDFTKVDPGRYAALPFMLVAIVFAAEHVEWFAGLLTGLLYGWLFLRTRDIWAAVLAHVVTNLMLGGYVLATGSYQFW